MNDGWRRLKNAGYRTRLYRYALERRHIEQLDFLPQDPWPGDPSVADALFRGQYRFAGREANAPNQPPWRLRPDDHEWLAELHGFEWLRHFGESGGETALAYARRLVRSWIDLCRDVDPITWSPGVLGQRITAWLGQGRFLLQGADTEFADAFLGSLTAQWLHLHRTAGDARFGAEQLSALLGLVYGAMALPGEDGEAMKGDGKMQGLLAHQNVKGDGFNSGRPSDMRAVLRRQIAVRGAVGDSGRPVPDWLHTAIGRMAPLLQGLRHGDGGLALFNGGFEENPDSVETTLVRAGVKGKALLSATQSGFQRMTAGSAVLLTDTGAPPAGEWGRYAHAGGGGFELSIGKRRLIVNCGSGRQRSAEWREAARATAAHSTLQFNNANAWPIISDGSFGPNPTRLHCRRHEDEVGNTWLELHHDGYRQRFGATHRRRLYLDASGGDVRGEDRLDASGPPGPDMETAERSVAVRFHLHPDVQASAVQGGSAVLLRLGGGQGWRFRAGGAEIAMAESVYLGRSGRIRRSQQIVLSATFRPDGNVIKWAFRQV
ncbi:MAG: heparinase II/III family protein [Alphaproteobacteria bacterium]|nr:heparinase II/III family protein [Alphaproteobacteria bacterium]